MADDNLTPDPDLKGQEPTRNQFGGTVVPSEQPPSLGEQSGQDLNQPGQAPLPGEPNLESQIPPGPQIAQEPAVPLPQTEPLVPIADMPPAQFEPFGSEVLPPGPKLAGEYPQTPPMTPGPASEQPVASDLNQPSPAIFQTQPPPGTVSQSPTTVVAAGSASRFPKIGLKVLLIVVLILFLGGGGASAFYFLVWQKSGEQPETSQSQKSQTSQAGGFGNLLSTQEATPTANISSTPSAQLSAREELTALIDKAQGQGTLSYETITTLSTQGLPENKSLIKIWQKGKKFRIDFENGMKMIFTEDARYTYGPTGDTYLKSALPESIQTLTENIATENLNYLKGGLDIKALGSENIDNKTAKVYQVTLMVNQTQTVTKVWVWEEQGFPLKLETTVGSTKTIIEYKNYQIGKVDDSIFAIPPSKIVQSSP